MLGGITHLLLNVLVEVYFPDHWAGSPTRLLGMSYAGWSRLLWIPDALLLIGLAGLYRHLAHGLGKLSRWGYWLAAAGFGLRIAGNLIEFWVFGVFLIPFLGEFTTGSTGSQLGYSVASIGAMLGILGLLIFGITCLSAALPTRWRILPLWVSLSFLSIFYFYFKGQLAIHAVLYGVSWMLIGYYLLQDEPQQKGEAL